MPAIENLEKPGIAPEADPGTTPKATGPFRFLKKLGPGLITGASDDDPSGIATYSQVGAQFGYQLGWTLIVSYPLMSAIQEAAARIGRVTGKGLATNIAEFAPRSVAYFICALLLVANTVNVAADIGAMAAALKLLLDLPTLIYVIGFSVITGVLIAYVPYERYTNYLKWLCLSLFAYVATAFAVHLSWRQVASELILPKLSMDKAYVTAVVAVFGTTISPYLFFWQASQEAEKQLEDPSQSPLKHAPEQASSELPRIRLDTYVGMALSNIIGLFIVLTTAATLHAHGHTDIQTSSEAAEALRPIAGFLAFAIFAAGIVGTGMLSVPVLAGSAAFVVCGVFNKEDGLAKRPKQAPVFYGVVAGILAVGVILNLIHIDPIKALFWSAVINALAALPVMALIMLLSSRRKIMKEFILPPFISLLGWIATIFMTFVCIAMFWTWAM